MYKQLILILSTVFICSCDSGPKVISPLEQKTAEVKEQNVTQNLGSPSEFHQVIVKETLHTERYSYALVTENGKDSWIAVSRQDLVVGDTYFFRGGLRKTQFQSQELDKVFDEILLVSSIVNAKEHPGGSLNSENKMQSDSKNEAVDAKSVSEKSPDAISLKSLIANKSKYEGKEVIVYGKCVKANYQIMGMNWYHIQDGSKDSNKNVDLTITSQENIRIGDEVSFKGIIQLNKDFGAGYKYAIIMEKATLVE
ncbi:MAG: SH3-like domain-containing protein [Saprospiraceae bacterium]|nr:SH3-like domain-containing protein [Saprospiraceae bacterium]